VSVGVDIYRYQTVTDWRALAGAVSYAWVKLTDGTGPAIVRGDKQVNGCKSVGIPVGGYHYAQPGNPDVQALVFTNELRRLGARDLAPALDLEAPFTPNNVARDFGVRFCRNVAAAGFRPAVYMSASWAGSLRPDQWGIPNLVIWIAAYGSNNGQRHPSALTRYYSGRWDVHQYTSTGRIAGISGNVDVNWAQTGVPLNAPPPPPPEENKLMENLVLGREKDGPRVFVGDGITSRQVGDETELAGLQWWIENKGGDPTVHEFEDLRVLGTPLGTPAPVKLDDAALTALAKKVAAELGTIRFEAQSP
jgi:GH25 family lysozyme M1 (1,4-beta-N-acetylmuramidase)